MAQYVYSMRTDIGFRLGCSTDPERRARQVTKGSGRAWLHRKNAMRDASQIEILLHQKYGGNWTGIGDYFCIGKQDVDHEHNRMSTLHDDYIDILKTEVLLVRSGVSAAVINSLNISSGDALLFDYAAIEKNLRQCVGDIIKTYLYR